MTEKKAQSTGGRKLAELIRKEFCSQANRSFLARMPAFRAPAELPDRLSALLAELDRAEVRVRGASRS